jgi:integrase
MTGTELKIITPAATEVLGPEVDRLATLHTNARTDTELLKVWLKSHADGSPHTIRVYARVGERFLAALAVAGVDLRKARVEDVQAALEAMRTKDDGSPVKPATVNTYAVNFIVKAAAKRAGANSAASVHWLRHAHASHAIDNGAPITLVSATLGHADLKTTSVYAHARPGESSGRYLKTK